MFWKPPEPLAYVHFTFLCSGLPPEHSYLKALWSDCFQAVGYQIFVDFSCFQYPWIIFSCCKYWINCFWYPRHVHWNKLWIAHLKRAEAATRGVLWKMVFLEISQNWQENTCAWVSFLIKLQAVVPQPS